MKHYFTLNFSELKSLQANMKLFYFLILIMHNFNQTKGFYARSIHGSYHHLFPTKMPHELKKKLFKRNISKDFTLVKLLMRNSIEYSMDAGSFVHETEPVRFYYSTMVRTLKITLHRMTSPTTVFATDVESFRFWPGPKSEIISRSIGRAFVLSLTNETLFYKQKIIYPMFKFRFTVPVDYNVNLTFLALARSHKCPLLFCMTMKQCTIFKGNFQSYTVITRNSRSHDDRDDLVMYTALVYGENEDCPMDLVKVK